MLEHMNAETQLREGEQRGGPGSKRERGCRTGRWMIGNSIILVCLHAVVWETHKGDRSLQFHTTPSSSPISAGGTQLWC